MKDFAKKHKLILVITIYAGIIGAFAYFFLVPLVDRVRKVSYDVQAKEVDREIEREKIRKLPEINNEWSRYVEREEDLNVILGQDEQVSFIENVESIAQASGNKAELKIQDKEKDFLPIAKNSEIAKSIPSPDYLPIQITLEGSYEGLVNFIHMLENNQFYVNIISISSAKNASQDIPAHAIFSRPAGPADEKTIEEKAETIRTVIGVVVYTKKQ